MPSRKVWAFNPDSGGIKIPDSVKSDVVRRVNIVAEQHFKGKYSRLDIRKISPQRGQRSQRLLLLRFAFSACFAMFKINQFMDKHQRVS
jgi:hypothetical protein